MTFTKAKKKRFFNKLFKITQNEDNLNPYRNKILYKAGHFYATDGYMIIDAFIPEYADLGQTKTGDRFAVLEVEAWEDQASNYISPRLMELDISGVHDPIGKLEEFFHMADKEKTDTEQKFDAKFMKTILELFSIAGVYAAIDQRGVYVQFCGRNQEISIDSILIGIRNKR